MGGETLTHIPADQNLRPLRDQIILEVLSVPYSRYILVELQAPPLEGRVLAVGPGCYPKRYDHPDKHIRTKTWDSKAFLRTEVKVGDIVKLGDGEIVNNSFQRFWWGDKLCLICRELDVCGIVDPEPLAKRPTPRREAVHKRSFPRLALGRG